ncbi:hypothetical protein [Alkaliphilus transvaalensis]|uniref:hypothetical protein n=1 Tax=Alkaliphilus transvaalensis TaxID=114628 RepID=UPI0012EBADE4|nr:hypothetical protein [Alkaliphilus transvaalensis]
MKKIKGLVASMIIASVIIGGLGFRWGYEYDLKLEDTNVGGIITIQQDPNPVED